MAEKITISRNGETRDWNISGDPGSKFEIYIKQGSYYYNFSTDSFQGSVMILTNQEIPSNGKYTKSIVIPEVASDTSYDYYIRAIGTTVSNVRATNEQKIGTVFQKGVKEATFTTTEDLTLSIASTLTGGKIGSVKSTLTQTGAVTEASGLLVYIHTIPVWDEVTGGAWTNSNKVTETVSTANGANITVEDGTNISSGYSVTGEGIIDEITVSAISGNKITLSTAQRLDIGQELFFSKNGWEFEGIQAKATNSGTTSVTMSTVAKVMKVGIADTTCELDIDAYISVKPNAFPIPNVVCSVGQNVAIDIRTCINYLGAEGDNDANQGTKTYTIFSIPDNTTSSRPIDSEFGTISLDADEAMGSAGVGVVTYTPHANMVAGDTDFFYYDCVDAQSTPVASATDQGKITITIV
tara:strand:- start:50 stop:1279 length:1230 start_codon:yes stop_codon:yes gene_type:complete